MRVFLFNQKAMSVIDKKEEITDETCLIDDLEYEKIKETLENNGYFWRIDSLTVGCSGKSPTEFHKWDNENKEWVICPILKEKHHNENLNLLWEKLKVKMQTHSSTGVRIGNYWFHTDEISKRKYDDLSRLVLIGEELNEDWNTMTGEVVTLNNELFKQLSRGIYAKTKHDYNNAKRLLVLAEKLDNPLEQEIIDGWSETYNESIRG